MAITPAEIAETRGMVEEQNLDIRTITMGVSLMGCGDENLDRMCTKTIKLLHAEVPGVKIIVGGAVLTPEYAKQIGADYYAKDAAESARIAEEVFGQ